jgi:hypothetical protein
MPTIDDVREMAYNLAALPQLKKQPVNPDAAIFRYWLEHKQELGTPATAELELDDGSRALITGTGAILVWRGGDEVEVL